MANVFEKGTKFAATALELLRRQVKAPGLFVNKFGRADFVGAAGDTINIKRPPLLRARDKGWRSANAIVVDDIVQSNIAVTLTKFSTARSTCLQKRRPWTRCSSSGTSSPRRFRRCSSSSKRQ